MNYCKNAFLTLPTLIITAGLFSSCMIAKRVAVSPDYTPHFQGQSKADIIQTIGVPDKETSDGKEGVIYEYNNWTKLQGNNDYFKQIPSSNNVSIQYVRNIAFFFDEDDKCYMVRTEATDIQRQHSPGRTAGLLGGIVGGVAFIALLIAGVSASY